MTNININLIIEGARGGDVFIFHILSRHEHLVIFNDQHLFFIWCNICNNQCEKLTFKKIDKLEKNINMYIFHIPYKFISLKLLVHM